MGSIGVVIVNYNGGRAIINCLSSLAKQRTPLEEIILVDNASTDGSPDQVLRQFPGVQIIGLDDNLGLSKARNIGLKAAKSGLVLLLDDDVYVDSECIGRMYSAYQHYRAAVICPRILFFPENEVIQCDGAALHFVGTMSLRHAHRLPQTISTDPVEIKACIGACMLLDRELALRTGGFDEEFFFYFEDLEFSLRMSSLGYRILCEPKALAYHDRGVGTGQLSFRGRGAYPPKRFFLNVRHRLITVMMHYKVQTLGVLAPALLTWEFAVIVLAIRRGWLGTYFKAIASVIHARSHIAARRRFLQRNRKYRDRDLLSGGELPFVSGFLNKRLELTAVCVLSKSINGYWRVVRNFIG